MYWEVTTPDTWEVTVYFTSEHYMRMQREGRRTRDPPEEDVDPVDVAGEESDWMRDFCLHILHKHKAG